MSGRVIRLSGIQPQAWKNGGGRTRELWRVPSVGALTLRISVADVGASGPFSIFPGLDRSISVLSGEGFRLDGQGFTATVLPGGDPFEFRGDVPVECTLLDGPVRDVNVMWARGGARWCPARRREGCLAGGGFLVALGDGVVVGMAGRGVEQHLSAGDTVIVEPGEVMEFFGEALVGEAPRP